MKSQSSKLRLSPRLKKKSYAGRYRFVQVAVFFLALYVGSILSFILPLRPTYSNTEKRQLTTFPAFSWDSLLEGSYFDNISLWFSDTFPFREALLSGNSYLQSLYGVGTEIHGDVNTGDEIPAVPTKPTFDDPVEPPAGTTTAPSEGGTDTTGTTEDTDSSTSGSTTLPSQADVSGDVTQTLGAVLVVGDSGYEYYNFVRSVADQYATLVSRAGARLNGISTVYDMVVPTSMDITLQDSVRAGISTSDQKSAIDYLYGSMAGVQTVNIYDALKSHRDEYLYFRTDHHWTALGAYYGYEQFAKAKGVQPVPLSQYSTQEFPNFLGAFYSDTGKSPALAQNPDTVTAYIPFNNASMTFTDRSGTETSWPIIADVSGWASSSKYNTFIGGDNPYTHIVNHDLNDGSSCLVIKESFGNALIPFLVAHYQDVHVIDYRYYKESIVDFAKSNQIQDVLFINNISATRSESLVGKMDALIP